MAEPAELWLFDDAPILGGAEVFALRLARLPRPARRAPDPGGLPGGSELAGALRGRWRRARFRRISGLGPGGAPRWPGAVLRGRRLLRRAGPDAVAIGNTARAQAYLTAAAPLAAGGRRSSS